MKRLHGFTLIELLVVIAIIAILAAILFPIFKAAQDASKAAKCVSNLKQIGGALQMYRDNNGGFNCHIWQGSNQQAGAADNDQGSFWWVITRYVGQKMDYGTTEGSGAGNKERYNVYKCPSAPWLKQEWAAATNKFLYTNRGLAYHMNETGWTDPTRHIFAGGGLRDSQFRRPSQIIIVAEAMGWGSGIAYKNGTLVDNSNPGSGDMWTSIHPQPDEVIPLATPGVLGTHHGSKCKIYNLRVSHNMGSNCLFYDGHVKLMQTTRGANWSVAY